MLTDAWPFLAAFLIVMVPAWVVACVIERRQP